MNRFCRGQEHHLGSARNVTKREILIFTTGHSDVEAAKFVEYIATDGHIRCRAKVAASARSRKPRRIALLESLTKPAEWCRLGFVRQTDTSDNQRAGPFFVRSQMNAQEIGPHRHVVVKKEQNFSDGKRGSSISRRGSFYTFQPYQSTRLELIICVEAYGRGRAVVHDYDFVACAREVLARQAFQGLA
jgi:hypothetical protein